MRAATVFGLVLLVSACGGGGGGNSGGGGGGGTGPTPNNQWTLSGRILETLTSNGVSGARLVFSLAGGSREVTASSDGSWSLSNASNESANIQVEVSANGFVTRRTFVRWNIGTRSGINVDLIRDAAPFSIGFYRQLARNGLEAPGELQPLFRLTSAPNFYINTRNPVTGADITAAELATITNTIRAVVPEITGIFQAGTIETGSGERAERAGFINVNLVNEPNGGFCGRARIGGDPGLITLNYGVAACQSPCGAFAPIVFAHEVGHALGFFHISEGLMRAASSAADCAVTTMQATERHHARIAYQRPRANTDTDSDPSDAALLQRPDWTPTVISCFGR